MPSPFEIALFGTTVVRTPERVLGLAELTPAKPRQLLEIVALARGRVIAKPAIAEALWAGKPPRSWPTTLEGYVAVLRRTVQPGVAGRSTILATAPGGYRLDTDRVRLDLDTFDELIRPPAGSEPTLSQLVEAAQLSRRDVLEHERYRDWPQAVRQDYARRGVRVAVAAARRALDAGLGDLALELASDAVARDPLAEDGWQLVIDAHGRAGRAGDALRAFHRCATHLAAELGVEPGVRTRILLELARSGRSMLPV